MIIFVSNKPEIFVKVRFSTLKNYGTIYRNSSY